jgi:hypothetical protein
MYLADRPLDATPGVIPAAARIVNAVARAAPQQETK